jgi:hypothetical protein
MHERLTFAKRRVEMLKPERDTSFDASKRNIALDGRELERHCIDDSR